MTEGQGGNMQRKTGGGHKRDQLKGVVWAKLREVVGYNTCAQGGGLFEGMGSAGKNKHRQKEGSGKST